MYPTVEPEFRARLHKSLETITRTSLLILARHLVALRIRDVTGQSYHCLRIRSGNIGAELTISIEPSLDHRFFRTIITSLQRIAPSTDMLQRLVQLSPPPQSPDNPDLCPACRQPVDEGDLVGVSRCSKGHEWSESTSFRIEIAGD